ncbi:MAG: hypothetical protein ABH832_02900, partial [bacterium]
MHLHPQTGICGFLARSNNLLTQRSEGNENLFSLPSKQVNYPVLTQRSEGNENLFSLPSKQVNYPV